MLPRHLQSLVARNALRSRNVLSPRALALPSPFRIPPAPASQYAGFHSSSRRQAEAPKSPFQTFVEVLRDELRKDRELQENVKQLAGDVDKLQDAEALKKARAAYERARVRGSVYALEDTFLTIRS
jgi:import inner membrane translocase subunit TIM44